MTHPAKPAPDEGPPASPASDMGLIASLEGLWEDLRAIAHEHLKLASLETRRAGESLASIVAYAVVVGVLIASAWLGVMAALVLWLIDIGIGSTVALLVAMVSNLIGAFGFTLAIRRRSHQLLFPATLRSLEGDSNHSAMTERPS